MYALLVEVLKKINEKENICYLMGNEWSEAVKPLDNFEQLYDMKPTTINPYNKTMTHCMMWFRFLFFLQ